MPGWQPPLMLAILLVISFPANAQVYKWTDPDGVVHYGDTAPAQQAHEPFRFEGYSEIDMRGNIRASEAVSRGRRELRARTGSGKGNGRKVSKGESDAQKREAQCQSLVERIEWIDSRLRAGGYSVNQGNRLRAERRELSGKRAWECLRN
ncbi:protein of unknown function [Marinobacter segnicrescens]|uniref:DUF4124 domain-containing protein n=2 Tax=Marinobacter segnicrescens TaxID=430453 RepID=A0A1I0HFQ7_9GAMM|nr:protein of unknown function [Marinobacter segnicrescens]